LTFAIKLCKKSAAVLCDIWMKRTVSCVSTLKQNCVERLLAEGIK